MFKREIKRAIAAGEMKLFYQPIINLETNQIAGQEALIRWIHPTEGLIPPLEFIPACEANPAVMVEICEFVVKQSWRDRHGLQGDFISINVSPKSLEQKRFWEVLGNHSLIADKPVLFLEITERSLANYTVIAPYFDSASHQGIGAFIDDFGVEYSGFIQVAKVLSLFPSSEFVKVKLDAEFANNLADKTYQWFAKNIIESMTNCPSGRIDVIAEGIEHEWQRDLFLSYGVRYGQGWLWGKARALS